MWAPRRNRNELLVVFFRLALDFTPFVKEKLRENSGCCRSVHILDDDSSRERGKRGRGRINDKTEAFDNVIVLLLLL